jgi:hypothetical protein
VHTSSLSQGRVAGVIVAAGLAIAALAGCGNDTAGPETGASVGEVQEDAAGVGEEPLEEPGPFVGQTVTVSADVSEIITPGAFTIAGTENTGIEPLLVIAQQPNQVNVVEDTAVAVTGTVRQAFNIAEVENEFGVDYDDGLFTEWGGEPYIVATKVAPAPPEPGE